MKIHFSAALLLTAAVTTATPSAPLMQRIMNAADKDKDGKLSLDEFKPLDVQARHHGEEHFKAGDKNRDGFIDTAELADALKKQTWFAILTEGTEASFARLDADGDSKLDATEYRKISKMGGHSLQHFKGADANRDSFLDLAEFTAHAEGKLKRVGSGMSTKKSKE
jgi:Ca2+-binding EF-hand superfamily protein